MKNKTGIFWIFAVLQTIMLGFIIFFVLKPSGIGTDTRTTLSILFPVFTLIVQYLIYSKK